MAILQAQRIELKYIVPDVLALRVRDFIHPYLELDAYGAGQEDFSYPVHSLYLDSPDLFLYQSTINGDRNRYKLRIRFYEGRPEAPVYFEIKRREDNAIYKQRCAVVRQAVPEILAGRIPDPRDLAENSAQAERSMHTFCKLLNQIHARPVAHVFYRREAWLSHDGNRVRVTMDRLVQTCREPSLRLDTTLFDPVMVFGNQVVLELKFTGRYPDWLGSMVRVFGLTQCSAAKYVDGIVRMGESPSSPTEAGVLRRLRCQQRDGLVLHA